MAYKFDFLIESDYYLRYDLFPIVLKLFKHTK